MEPHEHKSTRTVLASEVPYCFICTRLHVATLDQYHVNKRNQGFVLILLITLLLRLKTFTRIFTGNYLILKISSHHYRVNDFLRSLLYVPKLTPYVSYSMIHFLIRAK